MVKYAHHYKEYHDSTNYQEHILEQIQVIPLICNNLLKPDDSIWDSGSVKPAFLIYHFPYHLIHFNEYMIRNSNNEIRSWTLKGSMDNVTWFLLDQQINNTIFDNKIHESITFSSKNSAFNWLRFDFQEASLLHNVVYLTQIDFYGKAIDIYKTCEVNTNFYMVHFYRVVLILLSQS